ncbi:MAG TPA: carboxypeptidase regulatory-like domain-containing protein, partial [Vicinamibacterales bacterium]|nr:carboxypeptidase regulatory-like domain-containing protein [Vicinamibacterales bacterium]
DNPGTLVDVEVRDGALVVNQTATYPPGTPTLSGRVTEMTSTGEVPVAGASVWRSVPAGGQGIATDKHGNYKIAGLIDGTSAVYVSKDGFGAQKTDVPMQGDTRFDVVLVRR